MKNWNKTYNQNGFNLENARKMELNAEDLMILRWFLDFYPLMEKICVNNKEYGWVHYGYLLHNLQIIYCKEESISKRFQRYCELGLIEKTVKNTTDGRKAYFRAVENIILLYTSHTDKNRDVHTDKNRDVHTDKNRDNSYTINSSTINSKNLKKDTASGFFQDNYLEIDSLQVQSSISEKPTSPHLKQYDKDFEDFYESFEGTHPSKQSKRASQVYPKWKNALKTRTNAQILHSVQKYAEYIQTATWRKKKDIIAWLNSAMYEINWENEILQEKQKLIFNKTNDTKPTLRNLRDALNRTTEFLTINDL